MNEKTYMKIMRQDYPKDFADDDEFTSALLDWCESKPMSIEIRNMRTTKPSNAVWDFRVDRTSPVGNPFYMRDESMRDEVCDRYENYFYEQLESNAKFKEYLQAMLCALKQYFKSFNTFTAIPIILILFTIISSISSFSGCKRNTFLLSV